METRMVRGARRGVVVALVMGVLTGCGGAATEPAAVPTPTRSSPEPTPTPSATPQPLLTISGTVADETGQSLAVTVTIVDVQPVTRGDRDELAAALCEPTTDVDDPDARMVTMSVEAEGSPGFTSWTDDRGVRVRGTLYSGAMWREEAHSPTATCVPTSVIVEPGRGTTRLLVSAADWKVPTPLPADGAITLATYGFAAQGVDALGRPTGTTTVDGCSITTSAELDALVTATAPDVQWGSNVPLPEYCHIGRNPGGLD